MRASRGPGRRAATAAAGWLALVAVLRTTLLLPERCPTVDASAARAAVEAGVGWLIRNQGSDGSWLYGFDRSAGRAAPGYNEVRHAGVVLSLYQAAAAGVDGARASADRGVAYALDRAVVQGDRVAFGLTGGEVKVGASALLAAALTVRREDTGDRRHDRTLRGLGAFLAGQVDDDGRVLDRWRPATGPVPGVTSPFTTGEAQWALARLARAFPGAGWAAVADRVTAYLAGDRDGDERLGPLYADHWAAYGLADSAGRLGGDELAYARRLAGAFGVRIRFESQQRATGVVRAVRGAPIGGSALGTLGEGLGALWRLAGERDELAEVRDDVARRAVCAAGLLVDRQAGPADAPAGTAPGLVAGAWFHGGYTQMDDQQHAVSALLAAVPILEGSG